MLGQHREEESRKIKEKDVEKIIVQKEKHKHDLNKKEKNLRMKINKKASQMKHVASTQIMDEVKQKKEKNTSNSKNIITAYNNNNIGRGDGHLTTLSIILPCGFEHEYFYPTIRSIYEATPSHVLHEIVVVDDASMPPLRPIFDKKNHTYGDIANKVKFVRLDDAVGLIGAKHQGALASSGDIL
eukprot:747880-Ditylum_brightwellii.AAC.1